MRAKLSGPRQRRSRPIDPGVEFTILFRETIRAFHARRPNLQYRAAKAGADATREPTMTFAIYPSLLAISLTFARFPWGVGAGSPDGRANNSARYRRRFWRQLLQGA